MSQKDTLIKYLRSKQTNFTFEELQSVIAIINTLQEPEAKKPASKKRKQDEPAS